MFLGTRAATASYFIGRATVQSNVCDRGALKECARLCLALTFSDFTITTRIAPHAFRPLIADEPVFASVRAPAVYTAHTSAHTLSICACVHASLAGEPAPYGMPAVYCERTFTRHGSMRSACHWMIPSPPTPSLPCGSPAPAWSPNLRPACTCSS